MITRFAKKYGPDLSVLSTDTIYISKPVDVLAQPAFSMKGDVSLFGTILGSNSDAPAFVFE